ncbi:hypothetical protein [Turicibacter sanguinis]|nr:hypothetical protein [Turicibacter sanguinis]MDB8584757.1 hypothetical protein [Turicibacter sanguinis]
MQAYLFVHFREKSTPDGEQVHFGLSKDGFHWEAVNQGVQLHGPIMEIKEFVISRLSVVTIAKNFIFLLLT